MSSLDNFGFSYLCTKKKSATPNRVLCPSLKPRVLDRPATGVAKENGTDMKRTDRFGKGRRPAGQQSAFSPRGRRPGKG